MLKFSGRRGDSSDRNNYMKTRINRLCLSNLILRAEIVANSTDNAMRIFKYDFGW